MQQVWIRGYTEVQFEGDCQVLINNLNKGLSIVGIYSDIQFQAFKFTKINFLYVNRCNTQVAHNLARFGCNQSSYYADSSSSSLDDKQFVL